MKVVILAGGFGTRITEETHLKPKPLIEIGGMPILWHVMKIYSTFNINDFLICCGYKGDLIKQYFSNYFTSRSDITLDLRDNHIEIHKKSVESWKVTLIDTGIETMTGGRLKRVKKYLDKETFCLTYGDDLKKINISDLIKFHKKKNTIATLTAFSPPSRFGILQLKNDQVTGFKEKPISDGKWINGGYYVLEPEIFDYIKNDSTILEQEPLEKLVQKRQLSAFKYDGPYQPMDTLKDKNTLENLWNSGKAYWKVW